mmetsp:Transcript_14120/g.35555  ORF Transcript_14120/g.35555 Transcript_14120/m.35555 type:complete len:324 (+) Transcript_14120:1-972(+)
MYVLWWLRPILPRASQRPSTSSVEEVHVRAGRGGGGRRARRLRPRVALHHASARHHLRDHRAARGRLDHEWVLHTVQCSPSQHGVVCRQRPHQVPLVGYPLGSDLPVGKRPQLVCPIALLLLRLPFSIGHHSPGCVDLLVNEGEPAGTPDHVQSGTCGRRDLLGRRIQLADPMAPWEAVVHGDGHLAAVRQAQLVANAAQQPHVHCLTHELHGGGGIQWICRTLCIPIRSLQLCRDVPRRVAWAPEAGRAPRDDHEGALVGIGQVHALLGPGPSRGRLHRTHVRGGGGAGGGPEAAQGPADLLLEHLPHVCHRLLRSVLFDGR